MSHGNSASGALGAFHLRKPDQMLRVYLYLASTVQYLKRSYFSFRFNNADY